MPDVYLQHEKQLMIADAEDHYERKLMVILYTDIVYWPKMWKQKCPLKQYLPEKF